MTVVSIERFQEICEESSISARKAWTRVRGHMWFQKCFRRAEAKGFEDNLDYIVRSCLKINKLFN